MQQRLTIYLLLAEEVVDLDMQEAAVREVL
jgi:hypothetical protein